VYPSKDGLSVYAHDITDRKSAEEERERRARQHALVADLGLRALASDDLQALMDEAVGLVARTLDVEFAGVGELAPRGEAVMFRAGVGWREGLVGQWIERQGRDSLMGYTLRRREPVIVEEIGSDRRFGAGEELRAHGVVSAVSVMIETPDGPFGVLAALSARRHSFSDADVAFVQSVANVLAGAVERGRAQERLGEVREIERRRIARDLHDEALQELTDALAQAAVGRHRGLAPPAAEKLVETLKRIGRQLRGAVYDLRITDEQSRPFPDALRALVETHRERAVDYDIALDIAEGTHRRLPDDHSGEVLRIVGEALTNARRHAGARHVVVRAGGDGRLYVEVTDDGRGFDPAAEPPRADSCGLRGMRERAALIGGELQVSSVPGTGTTVRLTLGLAAGDHARLQTARILLVEDHVAVREAVAAMLANEPDLDVVAQAGSMAEAREALGDVDVAIVDLGLPDGFGGDLIGELRAVNPAARALVLSASVDPAETSRAFAAGADGSLDKTAQLDEVAATVRRLLPAARQRS
jgi:signal transduction histidine kinase/ActR/RegA family two-component response regulator